MSKEIFNNYKAVILDMDGVITDTARLHAKAWKQMFDEFLKKKMERVLGPWTLKKIISNTSMVYPDWMEYGVF